MSKKFSNADCSSILSYAWMRARLAAAAAGEGVRLHIGAAMRAAWAEAKAAAATVERPARILRRGPFTREARRVGYGMDSLIAVSARVSETVRPLGTFLTVIDDGDSDYAILGNALDGIGYGWDEKAGRMTWRRQYLDASIHDADLMQRTPCQQQQPCAGDAALTARRVAVVEAGMIVEPHPRSGWKVGFGSTLTGEKPSCSTVNTESQAVEMAEEMLVEHRGQPLAEAAAPSARIGYEFNGKTYPTAKAAYFDMMDVEDGKANIRGRTAFALVTGLFAIDLATGAQLTIDEMGDLYCAEDGPAPELDTAPDMTTASGLEEVLVDRTALLPLQGGDAVYKVTGVKRWTSPYGGKVRDYISLETSGMFSDDRKGPVSVFVERAGGGRGTYLDTKAGRVWWGFGGFCDSGNKRSNANTMMKTLLAPIMED